MSKSKVVQTTNNETKVVKEIEPAVPGATENVKIIVLSEKLNIRKEPDVTSPVITVVDKAAVLEVEEFNENSTWTKLVMGGYAMTRFIKRA